MRRLRISAISYLNTAPLMWDFEHGNAGSKFEISYTIPSLCAAALSDDSADIGIIPAAAYATIPDLLILPGMAIAARRAVRSILLVSKVPLEKIRTIALDTSSLTSVALTKVIFARWFGGARGYTPMAPELEIMLRDHDAGLLIGDPALKVSRTQYFTYDLAEEWNRLTGKPFVFAFWAVRKAALVEADPDLDLTRIFQDSRNHGLQPDNLNQIAAEWGPKVKLSAAEVKAYLTENIYYNLDNASLQGLQLFYRYAQDSGALPPAPPLQFYEAHAVAK
jgi:chorismate dehydratase